MLTPEGVHHELFTGALASHTPLLLMEIKSLGTSGERLVQSKEAKDQTRPVCVFQKHTTFFGFDVITKGGAN
jgi:hypothetical protein